jgi:N-acetylglucosaminyl-diphospho-decaprenol L-rhamnosyltransferase
MADLSVIIVSHNSAADLPQCLGSLFERQGDVDMQVVVADSGSTDETAVVAGRFPILFLPGENRGFAAANNRALAHAGVADSRYVLFLNPDTAVREGSLAELVALGDARPKTGVLAVRQVDPEGRLIHSLFRFPSPGRYWLEVFKLPFLRGRGHRIVDEACYQHEGECDWAIGACLLVRGEVLRRVGWFDERFFLTSEEVDLCRRVRAAGWLVTYTPSLTIMHRYSSAGRARDPWRAWLLIHYKAVYARKWSSPVGHLLSRAALALRFASEALSPWRSADERRIARVMTRAAVGLPGPSGPAGS